MVWAVNAFSIGHPSVMLDCMAESG